MLPTRWAAGGLHGIVWARGAALLERSVDLDAVDRLWHTLRGVGDLGDFVNALAEATGTGLLELPDFAVAVVGRDHQVQVAARGQVVAFVLAENGDETVSGSGVNTWSERHVGDARAVVLQQPEAANNSVERSLESGVVPACSLAFALQVGGAGAPVTVREEARRVPVIETGSSAVRAPAEPDSELGGGWAVTGGTPKLGDSAAPGSAFDDPAEGAAEALSVPPVPTGGLAPAAPAIALSSVDQPTEPHAALLGPETGVETLLPPEPDSGVQPADSRPAERTAQVAPASAGNMRSVSDQPGAGPEAATETVNAVLCPLGHANPPQRGTCRVCHTPLDGPTLRIARPSLGRLITPLGETVDLDGPVIIGRAPRAARFQGLEVPKLLTLAHTHISANHLALRLDGWHVLAQDLGSTNGTFLRRTADAPFRVSEEPLLLVPGDVIDLGHGVLLRFEDLP